MEIVDRDTYLRQTQVVEIVDRDTYLRQTQVVEIDRGTYLRQTQVVEMLDCEIRTAGSRITHVSGVRARVGRSDARGAKVTSCSLHLCKQSHCS